MTPPARIKPPPPRTKSAGWEVALNSPLGGLPNHVKIFDWRHYRDVELILELTCATFANGIR